jgi:hypothetical protein
VGCERRVLLGHCLMLGEPQGRQQQTSGAAGCLRLSSFAIVWYVSRGWKVSPTSILRKSWPQPNKVLRRKFYLYSARRDLYLGFSFLLHTDTETTNSFRSNSRSSALPLFRLDQHQNTPRPPPNAQNTTRWEAFLLHWYASSSTPCPRRLSCESQTPSLRVPYS